MQSSIGTTSRRLEFVNMLFSTAGVFCVMSLPGVFCASLVFI